MLYSFWIGNHRESSVRSLCSSEVTRKIKRLEVEEGHVPQCPIDDVANDNNNAKVNVYGIVLMAKPLQRSPGS